MKELIIFGADDTAELAAFYFIKDQQRKIAAFTLDSGYIKETIFCGRPVLSFETIQQQFPPQEYDFFVALGYADVNRLRARKYQEAKSKGYELVSYVSPRAHMFTDHAVGENCFILEHNVVQPFVRIGNNVTLWSGNHIGHHTVIEDHCFIASHAVISGRVTVGENSFVGVNATIRDHISIGKYNVIGAGAVIMGDTQDKEVYIAQKTHSHELNSDQLRSL